MSHPATPRPGSAGEHFLQGLYGTEQRAAAFYRDQLLDRLTPAMVDFLARQTQMLVATADPEAHPDLSVRFGEPGFVTAVDERTVVWPELRGNGVLTTLGNLVKNPFAHLMFLDAGERIGLHLRGQASILEPEAMAGEYPDLAAEPGTVRAPERWVRLRLQTCYVHCRKHFPLPENPEEWGSDDPRAKGGDYFGAKQVATPWAPGKDGSSAR